MAIGDFTDQAEAYHRSRPSYPGALLDRLADRLGLEPGDAITDMGAGTGILTALLADRDYRVRALDPNDAMRAYATPRDNVTWSNGSFEETGLPDGSQKWIVAAQAFHWADPPKALPALARALAPGGAFTILFNDRDHAANEVTTFVREVMQREVPGFDEAYRGRDWSQVLMTDGHFGDIGCDVEAHVVPMSRRRFLDLWKGHNRLNNIAGPERFGRFFSAVEAYLDQRDDDEVPVTYQCRAWTAWRLPRAAGTGMSEG